MDDLHQNCGRYLSSLLEATFAKELGKATVRDLQKVPEKRQALNQIVISLADKFNLSTSAIKRKISSKFYAERKKWKKYLDKSTTKSTKSITKSKNLAKTCTKKGTGLSLRLKKKLKVF